MATAPAENRRCAEKLIDEVIIDANLNNRDYLLKEARILKKSNSKNAHKGEPFSVFSCKSSV